MRPVKMIGMTALSGAAAMMLSGCIARTAVDIVTLPVKAGSQAVDWSTTSQDEADRNAGRKARKQQEREAREQRKADKQRCKDGGYDDC